jgi:pyrophosphate--fructose-6-phosphate 1-phosphotransferase
MSKKIALLTAGGFAPCLSTAVSYLIEKYTKIDNNIEIIGYKNGYLGLLTDKKVTVTENVKNNAQILREFGGSPIGNSRVKLTNADDLYKRGLVKKGENPLEVAATQLEKDKIDILHTIGGDDTNTTAADLVKYVKNRDITVVGLPKTIDNDIVPIKKSLGADTAADETAKFAKHIIGEHNASSRMLIIHEIMGRNCGWLTAESTKKYRDEIKKQQWVPDIGLAKENWDVHALYVPELPVDIDLESKRLNKIMDKLGNVNIFLSEGAGVDDIVKELESKGQEVPRDAFGHVRLDEINPGQYFAKQFSKLINADKVLVQKSGYFARSCWSNDYDLSLIDNMTSLGIEKALKGESGVIGNDEENNDELSLIDFTRIKGAKPFDISQDWFQNILKEIGQS